MARLTSVSYGTYAVPQEAEIRTFISYGERRCKFRGGKGGSSPRDFLEYFKKAVWLAIA